MGKKTEDKDIATAVKNIREEEEQPTFSEKSINAFKSGYVEGMSEALGLLDENQTKEDHLKKNKDR